MLSGLQLVLLELERERAEWHLDQQGRAWVRRLCIVSGRIVIGARSARWHASARNARASSAISQRRSRSGGKITVAPPSRKYRSRRNLPVLTSSWRERLVAATSRTST